MVTAYDIVHLDPLPGDPGALQGYAQRYGDVAAAIGVITRQLNALADEDVTIGEAADALRQRTMEAAQEIDTVLPRYQQSTIAIREYAVALADAQQRANAVIAELGPLRDHLLHLYARRTQLEYDLQEAQYQPDPSVVAQPIARRLNAVVSDIQDGEARLYTIWMAYLDADGDRNNAAIAAAGRIVVGAAGSTDTPLDHLAAWWADVTAIANTIGVWISEVLSNVLFYLTLLTIIVILLAIVAVALVVLLSPFGPFLLSAVLSNIQAGNGMDMLEGFVSVLIPIVFVLSGWLSVLILWESNTPTPEVRQQEPYWGTEVVKENEFGDPMGNYAHAFDVNNQLDSEGLMDKAVIDVVAVYDDAGNIVGYRVTLPSTMDWMIPMERSTFFDHGAPNDLASNLMLVLSPDQQAAYERMVLQAMADAGIGPDDPVMLVGFSQGGILAGKLASQDNGFNIQAVVTAGSPIDAYDIPDGISVLSMQHTNDPIARLDGTPAIHGDNWQTIDVPPPDGFFDHNGVAYVMTAAATLDNPDPNDAALQAVIADQSMFFSDHEVSYRFEGAEELAMAG